MSKPPHFGCGLVKTVDALAAAASSTLATLEALVLVDALRPNSLLSCL